MMLPDKKIIVIIPALNEQKTIGQVVQGAKGCADQVIIVDDASSDKTAMVAGDAGAFVIRHAENKGYDASIDDGFKKGIDMSGDIFATFDADGQHKFEDLKKIISVVENKEADLAIGQRQTTKHFAEKIFAAYTNFKYGIEDPLCGLKAYSREVYRAVGHFDTIKSIGTQLMVEAVIKGFKIKSVPVYIKERKDNSRFYFNRWKANCKIFMAMVKVILFVK